MVFALVPREEASDSSEGNSDDEAEAEVVEKAEGRETKNAKQKGANLEVKNTTEKGITKDPKTAKATGDKPKEFEPSPSDLD